MSHQFWRLAKREAESLGVSCDEDGLFLGGTPLIERQDDGRYAIRPQGELERLLGRAYEVEIGLAEVMPGLAMVARALAKGDLCLARIAAVHLRLPDVPDLIGRLGMESEDLLIKLGLPATPLIRGDWDPAEHPRDGDGPNPGWFATTDGGGSDAASSSGTSSNVTPTSVAPADSDEDHVSLPPAERIDELGDFVTWIANAKPEDEQTIRAEIKRYYYDVGDTIGGDALNRALSDALEPGTTKADRQEILDELDQYTRTDPREAGEVHSALANLGLLGSAGLGETSREATAAPKAPPTPSEAPTEEAPPDEVTAEPARSAPGRSPVWDKGWGDRGKDVHTALGGNLAQSFPVIDDFRDGIITSFKSIDLTAATYQNAKRLLSRINGYVNAVDAFEGRNWSDNQVPNDAITGRALKLVIPRDSMSLEQEAAIRAARERANKMGVELTVIEY